MASRSFPGSPFPWPSSFATCPRPVSRRQNKKAEAGSRLPPCGGEGDSKPASGAAPPPAEQHGPSCRREGKAGGLGDGQGMQLVVDREAVGVDAGRGHEQELVSQCGEPEDAVAPVL